MCIRKDLLADDVVVTHVVTCQGCDHIVNIRSGRRSLGVVNVHFDPELTHYFSSPHTGFTILTPLARSWETSINFCEPEEERFNFGNQTFTDDDTRKAALFHSYFSRSRNRSARLYKESLCNRWQNTHPVQE